MTTNRFILNAAAALACVLVATPAVASVTWYVSASNPNDPDEDGTEAHPFDAIFDGIAAAQDEDTVLVLPGTYLENIDFVGKAITVVSRDGPDVTIIDGQFATASIVVFQTGEGRDSVLRGFTITRGEGTSNGSFDLGGGIYCTGASPTIVENWILNNRSAYGGGIFCRQGDPLIAHNVIANNECLTHVRHHVGEGGGIYVYDCSATILNNVIIDNIAKKQGAGIGINGGHEGETFPTIVHCANNLVARNRAYELGGGGINVAYRAAVTIRGLTATGNIAAIGGGALYLLSEVSGGPASAVSLSNSILYGNVGGVIDYEIAVGAAASLSIGYCDIEGGTSGIIGSSSAIVIWGPGNLNANPMFVETGADYGLQPCSPCVNAGDPAFVPGAGETDLDGAERLFGPRVDMGAYELDYADANGNDIPDACEQLCMGDVNGDQVVSLADLTIVLAHFGMAGGATYADGDLDSDSDVDISDLTLFLANFGQVCP